MSRTKTYTPLNVYMNGRRVGQLTKSPGGETRFIYAPDWLGWSGAMPVSLSLPLQEKPHSGSTVISFFDNLLPDSVAVLKSIAERVGANGVDAYSLLSAIGRDCVGALQFIPEGMEEEINNAKDAIPLDEDQIEGILKNLGRAPLGIETDGGFRISLAGAQEKAAFLWTDGGWQQPLGMTPTTHIFKPQIGTIETSTGRIDLTQSVENEFYCLKLLSAFGLDVANAEMGQFGDKKVLIVERFDRLRRKDGGILRLPQEDICQALGVSPTLKYQNAGGPQLVDILGLLARSDTPRHDQRSVFMAQMLFWMIGATDGHAKNFSLFIRPNNQMALTPIYDVISAQPMFDARQIPHKDFRLAMSLGQKPRYKIQDIQRRHFHQTAEKAGLENNQTSHDSGFTVETIEAIESRFDAAFKEVLTHLPDDFPLQIHESICKAASGRRKLLQNV